MTGYRILPGIAGLNHQRGAIFALVLAYFAIVACPPANAEGPNKANILFIFSWHKNMPWQIEIEKGFEYYFKKMLSKPNLFYEYMDAGRFKSRNQIDIFKDYLKEKYKGHQIDYS